MHEDTSNADAPPASSPIDVDTFMVNDDSALSQIVARIPSGWGRWIDVGPGWHAIIIELDEAIAKHFPDYEVHQVKEKFGGLRYYCSVDADETVDALITQAEARASSTCESCGGPGRLCVDRGWYKTTCASCNPGCEPASFNTEDE
jgi:hypothetical protein